MKNLNANTGNAKKHLISLLTLLLILAVMLSFVGCKDKKAQIDLGPARDCSKSMDIISSNFDTFFAFSGGSGSRHSKENAYRIWSSSLLSQEDVKTLQKALNHGQEKGQRSAIRDEMQLYLGTKDGVDYIYIDRYNHSLEQPLVFKSNLPYSFASIIEEFERLSGKDLTQEFLNDCNVNQAIGEPGGIFINLRFNQGNMKAIEFYWAIIDGQFYVVCPALNEAQTENNA